MLANTGFHGGCIQTIFHLTLRMQLMFKLIFVGSGLRCMPRTDLSKQKIILSRAEIFPNQRNKIREYFQIKVLLLMSHDIELIYTMNNFHFYMFPKQCQFSFHYALTDHWHKTEYCYSIYYMIVQIIKSVDFVFTIQWNIKMNLLALLHLLHKCKLSKI